MENDFSKVSLGFAEFVSQLMHETFDAILDSQNYQLEKYLGLEKALNTTSAEFAAKYLTADEINEFITEEIGFELKPNISLTEKQIAVVRTILSDLGSKETLKSRLTKAHYELIYNYFQSDLVEHRKAKIRMFVERPELARLFVDSGEIKAKLNLSCLNETIKPITKSAKTDTTAIKREIPMVTDSALFEVKKLDFSMIPTLSKNTDLIVKEITDKETGLKTILINKESIRNRDINLNIPTARIVASPVNTTSSAAISSEVTIKFRSV